MFAFIPGLNVPMRRLHAFVFLHLYPQLAIGRRTRP